MRRSWTGYAESRLRRRGSPCAKIHQIIRRDSQSIRRDAPPRRRLVDNLAYLPLSYIRLMPRKLPLLTVEGVGIDDGCCYVVGFDVDRNRMQGGELHLTNQARPLTRLVNE